tara:strand:+ start:473 stop:1171 length:699 start_codon:yes stop_codon:yes gene_type:complete
MGKSIGIIQPGKIGDIIILLPAAKYYHDRGYKVYWPIYDTYIDMFREVIEYVNFLPVTNNVYTCINEAYSKLKEKSVTNIKDVAATFPDSTSTEEYVRLGDGLTQNFDIFKYNILDVPIDEKWNFSIKRDSLKENSVYQKLVKNNKYAVVNLKHSMGVVNVNLDFGSGQVIYVNEEYNLFHWLTVLEKATTIALVDSAMSNLVEQMNINCKKILFTKHDKRLPVLKNKWKIV